MKFGRVAKIVAGVVVIGAVAAYGMLASLDIESYRGTIIKAAEDATGRKVTITGPMKLAISFSPAVVIEGMEISNPTWAKSPKLAQIGRAEAQIALIPALSGDYQINKLVIHDTTVNLERRKDGTATWEFDAKSDPTAMTGPAMTAKPDDASGPAPKIAIRGIDIVNTKVNLDDAVTGQKLAVEVKNFQADAKNFSDPLKLTLDMVYNDLPISAKGQLGPVDALINNQPTTAKLAVTLPGIEASTDGTIGRPQDAKDVAMKFSVNAKSYDKVAKTFGVDLSSVPPLAIKGDLKTIGANGYRLQDGVLKLAGPDIFFNATADLGGKTPKIDFDAGADSVDVPKLMEAVGGESKSDTPSAPAPAQTSKGSSGRVFPDDPLPLEGLRAADVDFKLGTGTLILPKGVQMHDVQLRMTLKDGVLDYHETFGIGGGQAEGKVNLDARAPGKPAGLAVDFTTKDVNLGTVASEMNMTQMVSGGPTASDVHVKAHGKSVRDLMASMNGTISFDAGRAEVVNAELRKAIGDWAMSGLTMLDSGFTTRQKTVLNCMVVRFPVKDGVADFGRGIAAETDAFNVGVGGGVNLKTEALDIGVNPTPKGPSLGLSQATAGLVRVRGTMANPSVGVDVMGAGKAALQVGAAVATGGLSLLGGSLLNEMDRDPHPCQTALGGKAPEVDMPAATNPTTTESTTPAKSSNPVESIGGAVGGAVKGLFGK